MLTAVLFALCRWTAFSAGLALLCVRGVRVLLPFLTCFPSVRTEKRHFNINSCSLQVSKVHSFLSTSEQKTKSKKSQGSNYTRLISPFFWPFSPPPRVKYVEGRIARLFVCAWWELLNYCWMFLIIPHIGAWEPQPWKPHVPHWPGPSLCPQPPAPCLLVGPPPWHQNSTRMGASAG